MKSKRDKIIEGDEKDEVNPKCNRDINIIRIYHIAVILVNIFKLKSNLIVPKEFKGKNNNNNKIYNFRTTNPT